MDDLMITPEDEKMRECSKCGEEMTPAYEYGMCFWECTKCGHWEDWK